MSRENSADPKETRATHWQKKSAESWWENLIDLGESQLTPAVKEIVAANRLDQNGHGF
jgi:hypothetical protein